MSEKKGSGVAIGAGVVLAVPFAIVPAAVMLLSGSEEEQTAGCAAPGASAALAVTGTIPTVDGYTSSQLELAAIIMQVGQTSGVGERGQLVGLMTAMQESTLQNLDGGDRDSLGLFQQRPSIGWGTADQLTDPAYASTAFYEGVDTADGYHIPGLKDIQGWDAMPLTEAAQAVQGSAYPDAYAKHESEAQRIMAALAGVDVASAGAAAGSCAGSTTIANGDVQAVIDRGKSIIGTPYDFGGGSMDGPGPGGIDCSAFVAYAWTAAGYRDLPRVTQDQYDFLAAYPVTVADVQPGDLIYEAWGRTGGVGSSSGISHVTMYIGNDQVIEASRSTTEVRISPARFNVDAFVGIRRIPASPTE